MKGVATMKFYAHSAGDKPWEELGTHLNNVARLAGNFAAKFSSRDWGELSGRWHDLGKYSLAFQEYLQSAGAPETLSSAGRGRVDHSTAGAQFACTKENPLNKVLAYVIASHHSGLLDYLGAAGEASLENRLHKAIAAWQENAPEEILAGELPELPEFITRGTIDAATIAFRLVFWIRLLFSALVDADYLATEAFMAADRAVLRGFEYPSLSSMLEVLLAHLQALGGNAEPTPVNMQRRQILQASLAAAAWEPGFFELYVPTGGGKTLSALALALAHAERYAKERLIVVIPYTSIIEQTAGVYREIFAELGNNAVLEHHSNLEPEHETEWNRLQAENWDAPLIVTTSLQFFESLFAARTSRCRKLHNIVNSVLIFDEVQTLPLNLLKPTLLAMRELVVNYGCSIVLTSATQPDLTYRENEFEEGLQHVRRIIPDHYTLYRNMQRAQAHDVGVLEDTDLVVALQAETQVLCVVNTRQHAAALFQQLGSGEGHYHLSTRMCPEHRRRVIAEIRRRLAAGLLCRVISTQLIEAGVDLDFAAVYRARCGLDSLAQAAGRCNREGRLSCGRVYFFSTSKLPPPGCLRMSADCAAEIIACYPGGNLLAPECIEQYFELYLWQRRGDMDEQGILPAIGRQPDQLQFCFRTLAEKYRFIEDSSTEIIVPWSSEGELLVAQLRTGAYFGREFCRKLQRYTVSLPAAESNRLQQEGVVSEFAQRFVLASMQYYSKDTGVIFEPSWNIEDMLL